MRVLINTPALNLGGGVAAYCRVMRKHLPAQVEYFTIGARSERAGPLVQIFRLIRDYWSYLLKVKSGGYSLLQLNPSLGRKALLRDGVFLLLGKANRKKVILFLHGWDPDCERVLRGLPGYLFRAVYFRADAMIVLASEFGRRLRAMGYRRRPIFIETTAIDDELMASVRPEQKRRRFRVLFLARLERDKGVLETIEAYRQTKAEHPEIELVLAGHGPLAEVARQYVRQRDIPDVSFTGFLSGKQKADAFMSADCYFFPSYHEGMPTSILEAMAYGLPIITRPVGGIRDFFEDGKMGFLEESTKPEAFAKLLARLVQNPELCRRMGEYNRVVATQRFLASQAAARVRQIHDRVARDEYSTGQE